MITVRMIRQGLAPMARAASMTPGSMATRFCSTMRATAKAAAMHMMKIAADRPIVVPTTCRVSGANMAIMMMNGIGRMKFTRMLSTQ